MQAETRLELGRADILLSLICEVKSSQNESV
jgi:hypothetical protein